MTNEQILKKAIEKAVKNGYTYFKDKHKPTKDDIGLTILLCSDNDYLIRGYIFSHSFAKAFWGKKDVCINCGKDEMDCCDYPTQFHQTWKFHLQQMVLEEEPLKYLEKFL